MKLRRISDEFRFYVDIPSFVLFVVALALFWRPLASVLLGGLKWLDKTVPTPDWFGSFFVGFAANLVAAVVIGSGVVWFLRRRQYHAACGRFKAYDITTGTEEEWGTVTLRHELWATSPMGPRIKCKLVHDDITLRGEAILTREQHLMGYYREVGRLTRQRMGCFFVTLVGEGDGYEGDIIYLDPAVDHPTTGKVRWKSIEK